MPRRKPDEEAPAPPPNGERFRTAAYIIIVFLGVGLSVMSALYASERAAIARCVENEIADARTHTNHEGRIEASEERVAALEVKVAKLEKMGDDVAWTRRGVERLLRVAPVQAFTDPPKRKTK